MSLIDPSQIDDADPRPVYWQIADAIRAAIMSGQLQTGEAVPSEPRLAAELGRARETIREAYDVLRGEGRLVTQRGKPTLVRASIPSRRLATERYQDELDRIRSGGLEHEPVSAFTLDHRIGWADYGVDVAVTTVPAGDSHSRRLQIPLGTPILRRVFVEHAAGVPVQIRISTMPAEWAEGSPVADPERQPWPGGTIAELYSLGRIVTRIDEDLRVRRPTTWEARALGIPRTIMVYENTRVFHAGDDPVEFSDVVVQAPGTTLHWSSTLT